MAININTNLSMLNAALGINDTQRTMSDMIRRMASGKRINQGADDPSGLVATERINAMIIGLGASVAGNETSANMIRTAEGTTGAMAGLLREARTLLVDTANASVNDQAARDANQARFNEIVAGVERIAENSRFGNKELFGGGFAIAPLNAEGGRTTSFYVPKITAETLGTEATYTTDEGAEAEVTEFGNLKDLGSVLQSGGTGELAQALGVVDNAITQINDLRSKLGGLESGFIGPMTDNFRAMYDELQSAASAIEDADAAREMSALTRVNIQSQVKLALLAQGKDNTQALFQLLL